MFFKPSGILYIVLVLLTFTKGVLAQNVEAKEHEKSSVPSVKGLQLTVSTKKNIYNVGEPIIIELTMTNNSNTNIAYLEHGLPWKEFSVIMSDQKGASTSLTRYGKLVQAQVLPINVGRNILIELQPKDEQHYHFWVNRQYDMTVSGDYYVRIKRKISLDNGTSANIVSNIVMIKLVEPSEPLE